MDRGNAGNVPADARGRHRLRHRRCGIDSGRDPVENAWRIQAEIAGATTRVDAKASFALTLQAAVIAVAGTLADDGGANALLMTLGVASVAAAAALSVLTVTPRPRSDRSITPEPAKDFLHFGHLREWQPAALEKALKEKEILPQLSRQLIQTSRIAWRKHLLMQWAFALTGVGGALLLLAFAV
ncbi:DUF5706 domain-containing protein [Streptomyces sp. DSM 44917]|uniref:DUF5706 domain-containing protein n=1 Tax=Streptomyces boetiae TaxID=3075541 RepID=A0ABU2L8W1_9ACTN|nr:Pycsar system effector family protein [Streptomyces sp. DSM 44917]MDT0308015.1 DUF5706 domain-containing protein [Streptomyces sp. DSM 44917]